jgi:hypothetical protein
VGLLLLHIMGDDTLERNWEQMPRFLADALFAGVRPRDGE